MAKSATKNKGFGTYKRRAIQASGKTISARNAEKIKAGLAQIAQGRSEIAAVLAAAGHLDESEVSAAAGQVAAASLKEAVVWRSWFSKLSNILSGFYWYYIPLNLYPLSYIREYICDPAAPIETEAERQEAIAATIADAIRLLSELSGECPEIGCGMREYDAKSHQLRHPIHT